MNALAGAANAMRASNQAGGFGGNTKIINNSFVQHNTSPKYLSRIDIYRDTQNLLQLVSGGES